MNVIELFQDIAGKWRARVDLGGESQFFKFQHEPTNEEILAQAQLFLDNRAAQEVVQQEEKTLAQNVREKIASFDPDTITKAQAINAIELLIAFIKKKYGSTN